MKTKFKEIIRLALVAFVMMLGVTLIQAQPGGQKGGQPGPPPIPNNQQIQEMVSDLSKELSLTESQQQKLSEMFVAHFDEMKEVRAKYKDSHEAERKEMDGIKTEFDQDIKTVLTKDQQKDFDAYMKKKRSQKRGGKEKPGK